MGCILRCLHTACPPVPYPLSPANIYQTMNFFPTTSSASGFFCRPFFKFFLFDWKICSSFSLDPSSFLTCARYQGTAFKNVHGNFCPVVGLGSTGCSVLVNFGQAPFMYDDLSSLVNTCKEKAQLDNAGHLVSIIQTLPPSQKLLSLWLSLNL